LISGSQFFGAETVSKDGSTECLEVDLRVEGLRPGPSSFKIALPVVSEHPASPLPDLVASASPRSTRRATVTRPGRLR
jgi:hypothetical protein